MRDANNQIVSERGYKLAADPTLTSGNPTALKAVPKFDFKPLEDAVAKLKKSAVYSM